MSQNRIQGDTVLTDTDVQRGHSLPRIGEKAP